MEKLTGKQTSWRSLHSLVFPISYLFLPSLPTLGGGFMAKCLHFDNRSYWPAASLAWRGQNDQRLTGSRVLWLPRPQGGATMQQVCYQNRKSGPGELHFATGRHLSIHINALKHLKFPHVVFLALCEQGRK